MFLTAYARFSLTTALQLNFLLPSLLRMKGVNCQELAFHPRSCNRNVLKSFTSQNIFAQNTPRLFAYYEKLDSNCVYIRNEKRVKKQNYFQPINERRVKKNSIMGPDAPFPGYGKK